MEKSSDFDREIAVVSVWLSCAIARIFATRMHYIFDSPSLANESNIVTRR
jgi:hypothetical protein